MNYEKVNDIEIKVIEPQPDKEVVYTKDCLKDQAYTLGKKIEELQAEKARIEDIIAECDKLEIKTSAELTATVAVEPEPIIEEEIIK